MCLYPKLIDNRKYKPNKKNNFNPPPLTDIRVSKVAVGCGKCLECRKQKAREWQVRLHEEIKNHKYAYGLTFTFSCEELDKLCKEIGLKECNAVATKAIRRFLERWRKTHKKSLVHWFITELGHENTERIHLHGIIFSDNELKAETIASHWKYGNIRVNDYCNERTINYLIKYVHKIDTDHKDYQPIILCSKGIGGRYLMSFHAQNAHAYKPNNTIEYYRLNNGVKVNLPVYYRNKLWTEEERERLWIERIEKGERYVMGIKISNFDTREGYNRYMRILERAQETNRKLGFGDDTAKWKSRDYNVTLRMLNKFAKTKSKNS